MARKKKKIKIPFLLLILLLIAIIVIYFGIKKYQKHDINLEYVDTLTIKIGESLPTIDKYVNDKYIKYLDANEISWDNIDIEDNKIYSAGNYNGYVKFNNKKIELNLEVIDDISPIIEGIKDITIYKGEEVDLLKDIKVSDNSHDEVDVNVSGEYDISKKGEYKLSYVAIDKSHNKTVEEFKLVVKEKEISNIDEPISNLGDIVIGTTTKGYTIKKVNGIYYINGILIANKSYTLPSSYNPNGLLKEFTVPFNNMKNDAKDEGVSLSVISGYRSYSRQNTIYNNYVNRDGKIEADTYSARAGHSEHQTGLAADINSLDNNFINTKEGKWLNDNCYKYGFIIRYPKGKESITGYIYEPWHIRYVGIDIATTLYNDGNWISLEEYLGITSQYND